MKTTRLTTIAAAVLLAVFTLPGIVLGLVIDPWFFLIMLGLMVIPLLFVDRGLE